MQTVWVVQHHQDGDTSILGVFTSRVEARKFSAMRWDHPTTWPEPEPWDVFDTADAANVVLTGG